MRLNATTLAGLAQAEHPRYDRGSIRTRHLHIGIGGFHKAHQAVYNEALLNAGETEWGIVAASLRSATVSDQLNPQQGLYTLETRAAQTTTRQVIGAIQRVINASQAEGGRELVQHIADAQISTVTVTVTEKGYCQRDGALDRAHPDIAHDLAGPLHMRSLAGVLVRGLHARQAAGGGPVNVLSCDNLRQNGRVLRDVVMEFAALTEPGLVPWLRDNVAFPCSMVDRIVPQSRPQDRDRFQAETGIEDAGFTVCEPYRQWVIEDHFVADRPPWELAGAQLVADVEPYERLKLRILNGSHSAAAYLGLLQGYGHIHEVLADQTLRRFLEYLLTQEILPCVDAPERFDTATYATTVLARFANDAIAYGTHQVGTDGSLKIPERWLPVLVERMQRGLPVDAFLLALAAWLEHMREPTPDPLQAEFAEWYRRSSQPDALVRRVFEQTAVFSSVPDRQTLAGDLARALKDLRERGLSASIQRLLA